MNNNINKLYKIQDYSDQHDQIASDKKINDQAIVFDPCKSHFQIRGNLKDKVKFFLEKFKELFFGKIQDRINKEIFFTWNQKLLFQASLENIVKLNEKIRDLEITERKNPENKKLASRIKAIRINLDKEEKFACNYAQDLAKHSKTRNLLQYIGGTRVAIETKDHVVIDGMYLSAQKFQQICVNAGARSVKLQIPVDDEGDVEFSGLILDQSEGQADEFLKNLEQLNIFKDLSDNRSKGAGWAKININDRIAIIPDFEAKRLFDRNLIIKDQNSYFFSKNVAEDVATEEKPLDFDPNKSGTIILGMGAAGVYEKYKRESLSLLMQGMNVMLFNHRGHGESTGKPTEKGTFEDMESVYQYLKQVHHVEDKKIVARGLCLSSGIVSNLAARHPEINMIYDQAYADISDLTYKTIMSTFKDILAYKPEKKQIIKKLLLVALKPIFKVFSKLISPHYSTIKHLKKLKGRILILRAQEDTYTPKVMIDKIVKAAGKKIPHHKISSRIRIGHMPGIHGASWLDAKKTQGDITANLGRYHILSFLQENGVLNPFIDKGHILQELSLEYNKYLENQPPAVREKKVKTLRTSRLKNMIDGKNHFSAVLRELEQLKDQLGGSPVFKNSPPNIDDIKDEITILNIPLANVFDWKKKTNQEKKIKAIFWRGLAKLVNVHLDTSQYEEIHIRIQRFGMLIANKDRIFEILTNQDKDRYSEFHIVTGLGWHPNKNSSFIEMDYITLVEQFLTVYFEEAKEKGKDALIEYFNTFEGVCFEDRAKKIEKYIHAHPLKDSEFKETFKVADLDPGQPVEKAFDKELSTLGLALGRPPTTKEFLEHLQKKDIFNIEFAKEGAKEKPSMEIFHGWCLQMIDLYILEPYPLKDFLDIELAIFEKSGQELTEANFMEQLKKRDGSNQETFDSSAPETREIVQKYVQVGKLK